METSSSLASGGVRAGAGLREIRRGQTVILETVAARKRSSAPAEEWGFGGYRSKYVGDEEPPENQALRLRIIPAGINDIIPSNLFQEFICSPNRTVDEPELFWVHTTQNTVGTTIAAEIGHGTSMPTGSEVTPGVAPAQSYRLLFSVVTSATRIVKIRPAQKGSMDAHPVIIQSNCGSDTKEIQFTRATDL